MTPVNIPMNKNRLQIQRTDLCFGGGPGQGQIGRLGLGVANYYIQDAETARSYCRT